MSTPRAVSRWLPVVAWAALIFALSSIPHLGTGLGLWDLVLRKGAHTTEYAILGALLLRALERPFTVFLAGTAYAVTDELHQLFVSGRHASAVDVAIDAIGVAAGIVLFRAVRHRALSNIGAWTARRSTTGSSTSSSSGSTD